MFPKDFLLLKTPLLALNLVSPFDKLQKPVFLKKSKNQKKENGCVPLFSLTCTILGCVGNCKINRISDKKSLTCTKSNNFSLRENQRKTSRCEHEARNVLQATLVVLCQIPTLTKTTIESRNLFFLKKKTKPLKKHWQATLFWLLTGTTDSSSQKRVGQFQCALVNDGRLSQFCQWRLC